jgi:hypothetical protein
MGEWACDKIEELEAKLALYEPVIEAAKAFCVGQPVYMGKRVGPMQEALYGLKEAVKALQVVEGGE